jgi:hypothetical protein
MLFKNPKQDMHMKIIKLHQRNNEMGEELKNAPKRHWCIRFIREVKKFIK